MDLSFKTKEGRFNYRVGAIMIHQQKILMMKDEQTPYYYLPGGRVKMNETAEAALLRELKEESGVDGKIVRPLWLCQSFFEEDVSHEHFHECCLYFLVDVSKSDIFSRGNIFVLNENGHRFTFEWISFDRIAREYCYPLFLKEKIFDLPEHLEMMYEYK